VSVDTYLQRKNLSRYHTATTGGVDILLSQKLGAWADTIAISAKRFLLWTSFAVEVIPIHSHAPGAT
jgi:hypothetical protein